jgi:RNA polymerase sigma factor (sigma-70 family)
MQRQQNDENMVSILRDMCGGSAAAFDQFYNRYAPFVLGIAVRKLGDRMEAEDVCHDLFLEVLRKGHRYEVSRGSIESWLAVMTKSRCMDRLRKQSKVIVDRISGDDGSKNSQPAGTDDPEAQVVSKLQGDVLMEVLHKLPLSQRKAVAGAYLDHRSHRELADTWNVPLGTVKSWVRYGLNNIRKRLEKKGWMEESERGDGHE